MTTKDIRDIAAYWGASCQYARRKMKINAFVLDMLSARVNAGIKTRRGSPIHIYLRPLSSLTNEEVQTTIRNRNQKPTSTQIEQLPTYLLAGSVNFRAVITRRGRDEFYLTLEDCGAISYLQSIGVYVPGTIDPQYVQLIES